ATQVRDALTRLQSEHAEILQMPKIVAVGGQTATLFVGKKHEPRLQPDGSVLAPLERVEVEVAALVDVETGTDAGRIGLQVRCALVTGESIWSPVLRVRSDETAVLQRAGDGAAGGILFVKANVIRSDAASGANR